MPSDLVALSRRIAKLKPNAAAEWFMDMDDPATGLPTVLAPFSIARRRGPNYEPLDGWQVEVATKAGRGAEVVFDGLPDIFTAFRQMTDCFEAWQLIKPVERVYFIGTKLIRGKLIKVGFSRDPQSRLRALQTSHGEPLQIFATVEGGKELEAKYHRRWRTRRTQGEWFIIGDCIIDEIARLSSPDHNAR